MAEAYGLQNSIGDASRSGVQSGLIANSGNYTTYGVAGIGTSGTTAGKCIYSMVSVCGTLVVSEFWAIVGVVPTAVAPVFRFWRRPNGAQANVAPAAASGDIAMTQAEMTIPLTAVTGNGYVARFTANNEFNPGEAFIVELKTADTGAAATAVLGHNGFYYRFNVDSIQSSGGVPKPNTNSVGRIYVVTS